MTLHQVLLLAGLATLYQTSSAFFFQVPVVQPCWKYKQRASPSCCAVASRSCCIAGNVCYCSNTESLSQCNFQPVSDAEKCCGNITSYQRPVCAFFCTLQIYNNYVKSPQEQKGTCGRFNTQQVCPTPPPSSFARLLGGTQLADLCKGNGVLNFHLAGNPICNAVVGFDAAKNQNQIYITDFCKGFIENAASALGNVSVYNTSVSIDLSSATALGNQISTVVPATGILPKLPCKTSACVYNATTMKGLIDFNSCFINSLGFDQQSGKPVSPTSVQQVKVVKKTGTSCTSTILTPAAQCFTAAQPGAQACWGDSGAPVFCQLSSTKETVLYGLLDVTGTPPPSLTGPPTSIVCNTKDEFHVVPIP